MIHLKAGGQRVIILEPGNIERIKKGEPAKSYDNSVLIAYTPDQEWLETKLIENMDELSPEKLDELLKESLTRPEVKQRPFKPPLQFPSGGRKH